MTALQKEKEGAESQAQILMEEIEEVKNKDNLYENNDVEQINNDLIVSNIEYSQDVQ